MGGMFTQRQTFTAFYAFECKPKKCSMGDIKNIGLRSFYDLIQSMPMRFIICVYRGSKVLNFPHNEHELFHFVKF